MAAAHDQQHRMAGGGLGIAGLGGRTFGTGETAGQDDMGDSHDVLSGPHPLTSAAAAARPRCQVVRAGPAPRPAAGGAENGSASWRERVFPSVEDWGVGEALNKKNKTQS